MKLNIITILITLILIITSSGAMAIEEINLAVFDFYSDGTSQAGLGAGFSETLTGKLDKLGNVNIIQRDNQNSLLAEIGMDVSRKFDPTNRQVAGQVLGANYVLTGDLSENGEEVNVKYQLFNVEKGTVVAEESIAGNRNNLFEMQGEVGVKIAGHFNTPVSEEVKKELYFMPTQNMSSFENFSSGLHFYQSNRIEEAYNFFLSSVNNDTNFVDAHRYFEYTARKTGQLKDFIKNYEAMLAKDPENPILMNYLGNAYFDSGNYEKAESLYKESIKRTPTFSNPHNNLAIIYSIHGKYEEAIKEFENALESSKEPATIYNNMGLCYINMGDVETAKTYFKKALDMEPANPNFVVARYYIHGSKVYVTYNEKKVPEGVFGEISLNTEPVFEIQNQAGGLSPVERAEIIAGRLQELVNKDIKPHEIQVGKINNQITLSTASGDLILTITKDMAEREGTTSDKLAEHKLGILKEILSSSTTISYSAGGFVLQFCKYRINSVVITEIENLELYMVTPATMEAVKDKLSEEQTVVVAGFQHTDYTKEKMTEGLLKSGLSQEQIDAILQNSGWTIDTTRLSSLMDKEFTDVYNLKDELKNLGYDENSVERIGKTSLQVEGNKDEKVTITEETLEKLEGKVDTEELKSLQDKEITLEELKENLQNSDLKLEEVDATIKVVAAEKEMKGISNEATCLHRGDAFYSEGNLAEATAAYEKALSINPNFAPAHFCLGVISYDEKKYEDAVTELNNAISKNPEYFEAYFWLGKAFMDNGKKEEAKTAFTKALELEPGNSDVDGYLKKIQ